MKPNKRSLSTAAMPSNQPLSAQSATRFAVGASVLLGVCLLWVYWTTLRDLVVRWGSDPQYSHGYLVPLFSAAFLWYRRDKLVAAAIQPSSFGLFFVALGLVLRLAGTYFYFDWFDQISLLFFLAGAVLVAGGWHLLSWSFPAIAFLAFMIPLPYQVEVAMTHPLQRIGTIASTYAMQTLGLPAVAEGNVILLNDVEIGIVEACSGLRMMMIFFALSTAVALLSQRVLWERIVIVLSAVPIALLANITRITVTGALHVTVGSEIANRVFHDFAGWLMMPLALGMLGIELWLMSHLLVPPAQSAPIPIMVPKTTATEPTRPPANRAGHQSKKNRARNSAKKRLNH